MLRASAHKKYSRSGTGHNKRRQRIAMPNFFQTKIFMVMVVCVLMFSSWDFIKPGLNNFTPVENVRIESTFKNIPLSRLRQQVMSVLSGGYFTVDIDAIRNSLLDLPWVEDASVRRQWPSGLHIRVVEKQAVAFWGSTSLLSDRGVLFKPALVDRKQSLPQLDGPEGFHQKVWVFLQKINQDIKSMDLEVKQLVLDERRAWRFSVSNKNDQKNIEIRLGRANIDHRLMRFVHIFSNNTAEFGDIGLIDLRYPNGFAMRLRSGANHARNRGIIT